MNEDAEERRARREADRGGRPRGGLLGQLLLVVGAWTAYSLVRSLSGDDVLAAVNRGRRLLIWDDDLGFGWVLDANRWVTAHGIFAVPMSYEYASLHYIVTPLVLIWLWRRHPISYRPALLSLIAMSAVGLVVYVTLPVAPPRLLPGYAWMDTLASWSNWGWWSGAASAPAGLGHLTDQYAAMPSLHVGWAIWCAWAWHREGGTFARRFGWLYPASVATTVILTGNHYVLDVIAGAALSLAAVMVIPRLLAAQARAKARRRKAQEVIVLEPDRPVPTRRPAPVPASALGSSDRFAPESVDVIRVSSSSASPVNLE
jgi:membrane-associated phospholipid phosphatase